MDNLDVLNVSRSSLWMKAPRRGAIKIPKQIGGDMKKMKKLIMLGIVVILLAGLTGTAMATVLVPPPYGAPPDVVAIPPDVPPDVPSNPPGHVVPPITPPPFLQY